jgi:hypothetical protein
LKNPAALKGENVRFGLRVKLVRALAGNEQLPDAWWRAIEDLNTIRNKLAHHLEGDAGRMRRMAPPRENRRSDELGR